MPVVGNFLERLLFLRLNVAPGPALDLVGAGVFRAVATALKLGLIDALYPQPRTAAELARQINADERAVTVLLELLVASGYVRRNDAQYGCTSMTAKWLLPSSQTSVASLVRFFQDFVLPFWDIHIEESIRQGKPSVTLYESLDQTPGGWKSAQDWFTAAARLIGDEVVSKAKLPHTARRLLDIGGGHGLFSVKFCQRYPGLSATVFDQPEPLAAARETIATEKIEDKVSAVAGDYWCDDLGSGYDVTLLFNIIHANKPEENIELFRKVSRVLNPRGQVVILEQLAEPTSKNAVGALVQFLGLTFLAVLGGQTYQYEQVAEWLTTAGLSKPKRVKIRRAPGSSLILASKPA